MPRVPILAAALVLIAATTTTPAASASQDQGISAADHAKIEQLISVVEHLTSAHFVRNGRAYGSSTAARFLRGKWKDREASVHNVDDFIDKIATRSSTTGQPYLIRFDDGREQPTAVFLRAELAKLK